MSKRSPPVRTASDPPPPAVHPRRAEASGAPAAGSGSGDGFLEGSVSAGLLAKFANLLKEEVEPLEGRITDLETLGSQHDRWLVRHDGELQSLRDKVEALTADHSRTKAAAQSAETLVNQAAARTERMQASLANIQTEIALAAAAEPPPAPSPLGWDRAPSTRILRINCDTLVTAAAAKAALRELATDSNLAETDFRVEPENATGDLARRFVVHFTGEERTATRRCSAFFEAQRTAAGWRRLVVQHPGGGSGALYLDKDTSGRQAALERMGRRLRETIRKALGHTEVFLQRSTDTIVVNYKPVVKLALGASEVDWTLHCQEAYLAELGLEKAELRKQFELALAPTTAEPWCL